MTVCVQQHVSIRVERQVNVKLSSRLVQIAVDSSSFAFGKFVSSGVSIAAGRSRCTLVAVLVLLQPTEAPVPVGVDAAACQRHFRSSLAPVSVYRVRIDESIRVGHRNDVPVDVVREILNFRVGRVEKLVQEICCSCRRNPLASVNVRFNEDGAIVLQ